jgi:hypothetical protein
MPQRRGQARARGLVVYLLLGAALLRFSRDLGGAIGSFYRDPGLPQSRQAEPNRAHIAGGVASFWTWAFRLFGSLLSGFAVYILVAQLV